MVGIPGGTTNGSSLGILVGTLLLLAPGLAAQEQRGALEGTVTDTSGGAVVGAGFFTVFILVLATLCGTLGNINFFILVASSLLCGGIPGAFIGFHVETDN